MMRNEAEIVQRRFGPGHEKPCRRAGTVTCAFFRCQEANECQDGVFAPSAPDSPTDENSFVLNEADFAKFERMIANPPEPNEALRKLMKSAPASPSLALQSAAVTFTAAMAEHTGRPGAEVADATRACMDDLRLTPRRIDAAPASPTGEELVEAFLSAFNEALPEPQAAQGLVPDVNGAMAKALSVISAQARAKALEEARRACVDVRSRVTSVLGYVAAGQCVDAIKELQGASNDS